MLFVLVAEILALKILQTKKVCGIKINGKEYKLSQYADDTTCILGNTESIQVIMKILKDFEQVSGLRANLDKTLLIWLGPWKTKTTRFGPFTHSNGNFTLLGLNVGYDKAESLKHNFRGKLEKLIKRQNMWSSRNLTIIGKILVAKTLGISNIVYSLSNDSCPKDMIAKIQEEVSRFIWNRKTAKIKHGTLISDITRGGLRAPDLKSIDKSLKLAWLGRMQTSKLWFNLADDFYFKPYGGFLFLIKCNFNLQLLKEIPQFYKDILKAAFEIQQPTSEKIQIIWNNTNVRIQGKMIYYSTWHNAGIMYFKDLKNTHNTWMSHDEFQTKYRIECNLRDYHEVVYAINQHNYVQYYLDTPLNIYSLPCRTERVLNMLTCRCKDYCREFISLKSVPPTSYEYWSSLGYDINLIRQSLTRIKAATKDVKLIAFQYKLINNILANNKNLKRWGIRDSDKCNYCDSIDDIPHMYTECATSNLVIREVYRKFQIENFESKSFLFTTKSPLLDLINLIIKWNLWKARFYFTDLAPQQIVSEIMFQARVDKEKLSTESFSRKWQRFLFIIESI